MIFVQKFNSPVDRSIVTIKINTVDNSILWRHIQSSFGDVARVRVNNMDVHFMMNEKFEDILPLRIEAFPDSTMDVILSNKKNKETDLPPKYSEAYKGNTECIRSEVLPFKSHSDEPGDEYIRFGSRLSLRHVVTGSFLHSVNWKYKTGSWQHAVIGSRSGEPGLEDFWQVVPATGNTKPEEINKNTGETIRYGTRVRLLNVTNQRWLHSHNCKSPTSGQYEVSTYGSLTASNHDDVWIVERLENGTEHWKTSDLFLLRHEVTDFYLHSHMEKYRGENEVTGHSVHHDLDNLWRASFG